MEVVWFVLLPTEFNRISPVEGLLHRRLGRVVGISRVGIVCSPPIPKELKRLLGRLRLLWCWLWRLQRRGGLPSKVIHGRRIVGLNSIYKGGFWDSCWVCCGGCGHWFMKLENSPKEDCLVCIFWMRTWRSPTWWLHCTNSARCTYAPVGSTAAPPPSHLIPCGLLEFGL